MDVKSLFKSGKKTIKAFKIAAAPSADVKDDVRASEGTMEAWEAATPAQPAPTVNISVDVEEYKGETPAATMSQTASWSVDAGADHAPEEKLERPTSSSYIPPSQRRAEAGKAMPTLAEAARAPGGGLKPATLKPTISTGAAAAGPPRLKLITSAQKKAMEEDEKKKEGERKQKEEEKLARKEALRVELERTATAVTTQEIEKPEVTVSDEIRAAPLAKVYEKYIGRAKTGRKLAVIAA